MLIVKDILKNLLFRKIESVCVVVISLLYAIILAFTVSVISAIRYQPKLICDNSIGDIVITSIIEGSDEAILDLQSYNNYSRSYDYSDFKQSQIDPESLDCLKSSWVESYSGRLKKTTSPARLLLPFNNIHFISLVTGVDFQELGEFESSLADVSIPIEKKHGIILNESLIKKIEANGISLEVGDILRVEGDRSMTPNVSWDFAAPYMYLELLAIIPDSGGKINAGTEDRHNSTSCYVDYDSMLRIIEPDPKPKETSDDDISKISQIDILHPRLRINSNQSLISLPNQIYIRISDDKDIGEAIDEINSELEKKATNKQRHIAMKAEDYLELGNYQYRTSEKISSLIHQFLKDVILYLISFFVFLFLLFILINLTDKKRMRLQFKLGASNYWQLRYILIRNLMCSAIPGAIGVCVGLYIGCSYEYKNYGFRHISFFLICFIYALYLFLIISMSIVIFFSEKNKEECK